MALAMGKPWLSMDPKGMHRTSPRAPRDPKIRPILQGTRIPHIVKHFRGPMSWLRRAKSGSISGPSLAPESVKQGCRTDLHGPITAISRSVRGGHGSCSCSEREIRYRPGSVKHFLGPRYGSAEPKSGSICGPVSDPEPVKQGGIPAGYGSNTAILRFVYGGHGACAVGESELKYTGQPWGCAEPRRSTEKFVKNRLH